MEIQGRLIQKQEKQTGTSKNGNEWEKQQFVVEADGNISSFNIAFDMFGEKNVSLLDTVEIGDNVKVYFNIVSREWNGKWFTNANAWKLEKINKDIF